MTTDNVIAEAAANAIAESATSGSLDKVIVNNETIKIIIVKKYLLISALLVFDLVNETLFK